MATTLYQQSDRRHARMIWAGGAGCHYGGRAGGCLRNGNDDFLQTGMIIDQTLDEGGDADDLGYPILLARTGLVTFTRFAGAQVFFTTETG